MLQGSAHVTRPATVSLAGRGLFLFFGKKLLYSGVAAGACLSRGPEPVLDPRNETEFRAELHA